MRRVLVFALALAAAGCAGQWGPRQGDPGSGLHRHGPLLAKDWSDEVVETGLTAQDRIVEVVRLSDFEGARGRTRAPRSVAECAEDGEPVADNSIRGSFLRRPGRGQILYTVYTDGRCDSAYLAVVAEGETVLSKFPIPGVAVRAEDVDGDGTDEVIVTSVWCKEGCRGSAWVVRADGSVLWSGEDTYVKSCGSRGGRIAWETVSLRASGAGLQEARTKHWARCPDGLP